MNLPIPKKYIFFEHEDKPNQWFTFGVIKGLSSFGEYCMQWEDKKPDTHDAYTYEADELVTLMKPVK